MMKSTAPSMETPDIAAENASMRRCLVSGQSKDKDRLIRFVASPEGEIVADIFGRLGGRGVWVTAEKTALDQAVSKKLFARALRQPVCIKEGFVQQIGVQFAQLMISRMSLMRKSGLLIAGRAKLEMAAQRLEGVIIADDASQREAAALLQMVCPNWHETNMPSEYLGQVAGVSSLAYAGVLAAGQPSEQKQIDRLLLDIQRWRAVTETQKQQIRS